MSDEKKKKKKKDEGPHDSCCGGDCCNPAPEKFEVTVTPGGYPTSPPAGFSIYGEPLSYEELKEALKNGGLEFPKVGPPGMVQAPKLTDHQLAENWGKALLREIVDSYARALKCCDDARGMGKEPPASALKFLGVGG
jgi:hypothetical protein